MEDISNNVTAKVPDQSIPNEQPLHRRRAFLGMNLKDIMSFLSSLIVPLVLGAFTIFVTFQQQKIAKEQRTEDQLIAREQRLEDQNQSYQRLQYELQKDKIDRDIQMSITIERHRDEVLVAYIREMGDLLKSHNYTLVDNIKAAALARAKTLSALHQLDGTRNSQILRFLSETMLLNHGTEGEPLDISTGYFTNVDKGVLKTSRRMGILSLTGTTLENCTFTDIPIDSVDLSLANLKDVSFSSSKVNLNSHILTSTRGTNSFITVINNMNFTFSKLKQVDFAIIKLTHTAFASSRLEDVSFTNSQLYDINFNSAQLVNVDFSFCELASVDFSFANLQNVNFSFATLRRVIFKSGVLSNVNFSSALIYKTSFERAIYHKAQFPSAALSKYRHVFLVGSYVYIECLLVFVDFLSATMSFSNFFRARQMQVNFDRTFLQGSNFALANFKGARLYAPEQYMEHINISGTNLQYTEVLNNGICSNIKSNRYGKFLSIHNLICGDQNNEKDSNLIVNGYVRCNASLWNSWTLIIGKLEIVTSKQNKSECRIVLSSGVSKAIMLQNISLKNSWDPDLWPFSFALLHAKMSTGVLIELAGVAHDDSIINQHRLESNSRSHIRMRLDKNMYKIMVRVLFQASEYLRSKEYVWCGDIELFIEYGTEFETETNIPMRAEWKQTGITLIQASTLSYAWAVNKYDDDVYIVTGNKIRVVNSTSVDTNRFVMPPVTSTIDNLNALLNPTDVLLHESSNSLVICDKGNRRLWRWSLELNEVEDKIILKNVDCFGLAADNESTLYISDQENHGVIKYNTKIEQNDIAAGGRGEGKGLYRLNSPTYIVLDHNNNLYVSDTGNHRVMKWTREVVRGTMVAGHERHGNQLNQLNTPVGLALNEKNNSIIICDYGNRRIMRWSLQRHTTEGEMLLNDIDCFGLTMDDEGALFVSDIKRHEIIMYAEGSTNGVSVAGGDGPGDSLDQLSFPHKVTIDSKDRIYVADSGNHRVVRWAKGEAKGIIMTSYKQENSLSYHIICSLLHENILILCDLGRNRIIKVSLHNDFVHFRGYDEVLTDIRCKHMAMDIEGTLYVIADPGDEVRRYPKGSTTEISVISENTEGGVLKPLGEPFSMTVDNNGTLYILNEDKHVVRLKDGKQEIIIRARKEDDNHYDLGFSYPDLPDDAITTDTTIDPTAIIFDVTDNSLVICDQGNSEYYSELTRWSLQINATKIKTIQAPCKGLVTDNKGTLYISKSTQYWSEIMQYNPANDYYTTLVHLPQEKWSGFFTVDDNGTVYFSYKYDVCVRVRRKDGTKDILFANQHEKLFALNSLKKPTKLLYDKKNDAIIICDSENYRVVRWSLNPYTTQVEELIENIKCNGLAIDSEGAIYVTIHEPHEVRRYSNGSTKGMTVAGGSDCGKGPYQLCKPSDIVLDNEDTLFVVDDGNERIMMWKKGIREGILVVNFSLTYGQCGRIKVASLLYDAKANVFIGCNTNRYGGVFQFSLEPNKTTCQELVYRVDCGGLAIDDEDTLYVTNPRENRVQKYVNRSRLSAFFGFGGNGLHELSRPTHAALNGRGDLLISDTNNNRIVKWKKGAKGGQIVLKPKRPGFGYSQLENPTDLLYDKNTNSIIVCDSGYRRIVQWFLEYLTIRGQNLIDTIDCHGLAMDFEGALYVSIPLRNEIRRYARGDETGTIVAGGNGEGSDLHQLDNPTYICVDSEGSLFIADTGNDRVVQWRKGANVGVIIAGHGGYGYQAHQLRGPANIALHTKSNSIFICDKENRRVMRWSLQNRTTVGIPVINNISCSGIAVDDNDTLYVTDHWTIKQYPKGYTQFNSVDLTVDNWADLGPHSYFYSLRPSIISVDSKGTMYVLDDQNRVALIKMKTANHFHIVAGHRKNPKQLNQLDYPTDLLFDRTTHSILVCDLNNLRVMRWILASDTNEGIEVLRFVNCRGMTIDKNGAIYVRSSDSNKIKRYGRGSVTGMFVASKHGEGSGLHQFNQLTSIAVDSEGAIYVSDSSNHRVMKWTRGAQEGIIVAGGNGEGNSLTQLKFPQGVIVDHLGTVYVTDRGNSRIMRWPKGATEGSVIIGGSEDDRNSEQIRNPYQLSFDRYGNLYVYDAYFQRVSRFDIISPKENATVEKF